MAKFYAQIKLAGRVQEIQVEAEYVMEAYIKAANFFNVSEYDTRLVLFKSED
jgi:hypothetical protein